MATSPGAPSTPTHGSEQPSLHLDMPRSPLDSLAAGFLPSSAPGLPRGAGEPRAGLNGHTQLDDDDFFGGRDIDEAVEDGHARNASAGFSAHARTDSNFSYGHQSNGSIDSTRAAMRTLPKIDTSVFQGQLPSVLGDDKGIISMPSKESLHSSNESQHRRTQSEVTGLTQSASLPADSQGFPGFNGTHSRTGSEGDAGAPLQRRSSFFEEHNGHVREASFGRAESWSPEPSPAAWRRSAMMHTRSQPSSLYGGSQPETPQLPLFDQSHLKPGSHASLLSSAKTLELYRANVRKTNDPDVAYEFAVLLINVARDQQVSFSPAASSAASSDTPTTPLATPASAATDASNYGKRFSKRLGKEKEKSQDPLSATSAGPNSAVDDASRALSNAPNAIEAVQILKRIADRGHVGAQALLGDCYAKSIGTGISRKPDYDKAFSLFVLAGKHGHPEASYRVGQCCENGWGCRKDYAKAVTWYNKAASVQHAAAMYRLGVAGLNSELGLSRRQKEGFKWLKRAAELAHSQPETATIQALYELAILHEKGVEHVVFVDYEYAAELLAKASELGHAPSAYKLGECYEYGKMGCPQDSALSIHYYNIAAQQGHREACFALTAWYLVGSPGVLPQSDTEAYLWAKRAADQGLAKAEYAVGYFTEVGMGRHKDPREAMGWFRKAAEHGDKRAIARLKANAQQVAQLQREEAARQAEIRREAAAKEAASQKRAAEAARARAEREAQLARERDAQQRQAEEAERRRQAALYNQPGFRTDYHYSQGGRRGPAPGTSFTSPSQTSLRGGEMPAVQVWDKPVPPRPRERASSGQLREKQSLPRLRDPSPSPRLRETPSQPRLHSAPPTRSASPRLPPGAGSPSMELPRPRTHSSGNKTPTLLPAPIARSPLADQSNGPLANKDENCIIM